MGIFYRDFVIIGGRVIGIIVAIIVKKIQSKILGFFIGILLLLQWDSNRNYGMGATCYFWIYLQILLKKYRARIPDFF